MLGFSEEKICEEGTKKEITTVLNRRLILPFYMPIVSLLCSFCFSYFNINKKMLEGIGETPHFSALFVPLLSL